MAIWGPGRRGVRRRSFRLLWSAGPGSTGQPRCPRCGLSTAGDLVPSPISVRSGSRGRSWIDSSGGFTRCSFRAAGCAHTVPRQEPSAGRRRLCTHVRGELHRRRSGYQLPALATPIQVRTGARRSNPNACDSMTMWMSCCPRFPDAWLGVLASWHRHLGVWPEGWPDPVMALYCPVPRQSWFRRGRR